MNTYLVKTDYFSNIIEKALEKRGNWIKYNPLTDNKLTYIYVDGKYIQDKSLFSMKSYIKNIVYNSKSISIKSNLYINLLKKYPKICNTYMMKQYFITKDTYKDIDPTIFNNNNIYILKPIKGFSGSDIKIFHNFDKYYKYIDNYIKKNNKITQTGWVLAKYITNPLLFNNRKFHLRVYFLYYIDPILGKRGFILNKSKLYTAKQDFSLNLSNIHNKDIHDTHNFGDNIYLFPDDFDKEYNTDKSNIVFNQIKNLFYYILQFLDEKCYQESKVCYEIFGADIIVLDNYNIKLLEINDKVGYSCKNKICDSFNNYFVNGFLVTIIDKIIPPKIIPGLDNKINYYTEITNKFKLKKEKHDKLIYQQHGGIYSSYYYKYIKYKTKYLQLTKFYLSMPQIKT